MNWKARIGDLVLVKHAVAQLDRSGLWSYRLPELAASEAQLERVEGAIGEPIDLSYRAFLSCAGGWRAIYLAVDLFGPAEYLGSDAESRGRWERANERLGNLDRLGMLRADGLSTADLLPIAVSANDADIFVLGRYSSIVRGQVLWFAEDPVDRFASFEDYFLAMIEYNRLDLRDERERLGQNG
ncbi:MAG: SMI1/KNR4 family protein [Deltaproteobacteria bacterium]|nr:SMI1/KNR4 family protein [Deltaproteobacteria bacterium]